MTSLLVVPPPDPGNTSRLILEGPDDSYAIRSLVRVHLGGSSTPQRVASWFPFFFDAKGVDNAVGRAAVTTALKTHTRLGWVIDRDSPPNDRWPALRDALREGGLSVPDDPQKGGVQLDGQERGSKVGVWIMPDNHALGSLEDFLVPLVTPQGPLWDWAMSATATAVRLQHAQVRNVDLPKAHLHTWLAWQREPAVPLGLAIEKGYLDGTTTASKDFVDWFLSVFCP